MNKPSRNIAAAVAEGTVDGTQTVRRAAAVLRCVGQANAQGIGLTALTETLQLSRSTTHRILKCLVEEGLIEHDATKRRYLVGRLIYELGLTVTSDVLDIARWRVAVDRVAARTGVTAYLMSRSGIEGTCILKTEGNAAIRVIPVDLGQRRLLGIGAGATALLAALEPETAEQIIRTIGPSLRVYPHLDETVIRRLVEETRRTGFAVSRSNIVRDALGIGMAIPKPGGIPSLALSIAALASQTDDKVIPVWQNIIRQEIEAVLAS